MKRILLAVAVCLVLALGLFLIPQDVHAATTTASGSCGDNVRYTLDSDGVLTISGSGKMADYGEGTNNTPWYSYNSSI